MELVSLDYAESVEILKESWGLWSTGLRKADYYEHNLLQLTSPWGRRNLRYYGLKEKGRLLGSLKSYNLEAVDHSRSFKVHGLGAVFVKEEYRGRGYGLKLLQEYIRLSREEEAQGILLFSDIDSQFYEQVGFELIGCFNFRLQLAQNSASAAPGPDTESYEIRPLIDCDFDELARHHSRWLKSRSFGIKRDSSYFRFKAQREDFLQRKSKNNWPQLQVLTITSSASAGYALFEIRSGQLRVLEVCPHSQSEETLWQALYQHAQNLKLEAISGWEGLLANLEPAFNLNFLRRPEQARDSRLSLMSYTERSWSQAMVLPLEKRGIKRRALAPGKINALGQWQDVFPCPLLELDHL